VILPLDGFIPNTKKSLAVKEVKDGLDAAEQHLADTLQAGAIAINSAVLNLNKSAASLRSLELNVVLAEESYSLVSRSYDVGEADYLQVQTADDELNTARIQLVNEKFNYASNLEDLDFAIANALEVTPAPLEAVVSQPDTEQEEEQK
jgi:outer membrane protein TolC